MKRVLYVVLKQWSDWELGYLTSAVTLLGNGRYENKTVSLTKAAVPSIGGIACLPDYDIASVPKDYEGLILIGGLSWHGKNVLKLRPLVEDCIKRGKVLGAICDACRFLGAVGALNGVKHTANDLNELKQYASYKNEAEFVRRQAVSDGNIVTANGTATLEFAEEVLRALAVSSEQAIKGWYDFYKLGFYTVPMPKF